MRKSKYKRTGWLSKITQLVSGRARITQDLLILSSCSFTISLPWELSRKKKKKKKNGVKENSTKQEYLRIADYQGKLPGTDNLLSSPAKSSLSHIQVTLIFHFLLLYYLKFNSLGVFLINRHPFLRIHLPLEMLYGYQSFTNVCKLVSWIVFLLA